MTDPFGFSESFGQLENILFTESFGDEFNDPVAQALYHEAYFSRGTWETEELGAIRDNLRSYLMDEYGINFDEVFDWAAWREAYEE